MRMDEIREQLDYLFALFKQASQEGAMPSHEDLDNLMRLSRRMHSQADEEWLDEAEDFLHLANQLQVAVKQDNVQDAIPLIDSLNEAYSFCYPFISS